MKKALIALLILSILLTCGCINKNITGDITNKETSTNSSTISSTTSTVRTTYTTTSTIKPTTTTTSTSATTSTKLPTTTSSSTTTTADRGETTSTTISSTTSTTTTIDTCPSWCQSHNYQDGINSAATGWDCNGYAIDECSPYSVSVSMNNGQCCCWECNIPTTTSTTTTSSSSTTTTFTTTSTTILQCEGTFNATVDYVKDGDSLRVKECEKDIRLALTNAYEWYEPGGEEAKEFTKNLCKKGYKITIDEDSGQTGKDRIIALVYCQDKKLNAELLYEGLAVIDTRFCYESEFSDEDWAHAYGC